jgi:hypothetical protein
MSSAKTRNQFALLGKVPESPYGTPLSLSAAADGILPADFCDFDFSAFLNDGSRGKAPGGGSRQRVKPSGRIGSLTVPFEGTGAAAAYSASVFPAHHILYRASGLEATGSFAGGTESWKYAPEVGPTGLDAGSFEYYEGGQKYPLAGAYGSLSCEVDGPDVPRWACELLGIGTTPTDVALPTVSGGYPPASRLPPKAESIALTLGLFTGGIVRGFKFNQNREHDAQRKNVNSGGHAGYTPGGFNPTMEVTLEQCALATVSPWSTATTFNPYALKDDGQLIVCALTVGSVQYNRWKICSGASSAALQAQVVDVSDELDGPTRLWVVTLEFKPSALTLVDSFTIEYN